MIELPLDDDDLDPDNDARRRPRPPSAVRDPEEIVAALAERDFEVRLTPNGAIVVADLKPRRKRPREMPPWLADMLWSNADEIGRYLEQTTEPPPDDGAPPDCGHTRPVTGIRRFYNNNGEECAELTYGPWQSRWEAACRGAARFILDGWAIKALELGWTVDELYRVPPLRSQIHLTGATLLIGDLRVVEVTADAITIETDTGARLKFRPAGREHVA
jgi:hypothetical protein